MNRLTAQHDDSCLSSYDFALYVSGSAFGEKEHRIQTHLQMCTACFEIYIRAFDDQMDQLVSEAALNPALDSPAYLSSN